MSSFAPLVTLASKYPRSLSHLLQRIDFQKVQGFYENPYGPEFKPPGGHELLFQLTPSPVDPLQPISSQQNAIDNLVLLLTGRLLAHTMATLAQGSTFDLLTYRLDERKAIRITVARCHGDNTIELDMHQHPAGTRYIDKSIMDHLASEGWREVRLIPCAHKKYLTDGHTPLQRCPQGLSLGVNTLPLAVLLGAGFNFSKFLAASVPELTCLPSFYPRPRLCSAF